MSATGAESTLGTAKLETPVFLGGGRRRVWLRWTGLAAALVVVLWLAALVAGVFGFGNVAGLKLPGAGVADSPVLHRAHGPAPGSIKSITTATGTRGPGRRSATGHDGRARSTAGRGASARTSATRRTRGVSGTARRVRTGAMTTTSSGAATSPSLVHGQNGVGTGGSTTTAPSTSNTHRASAPGQQMIDPPASGPRSPNAHANRTTTTG